MVLRKRALRAGESSAIIIWVRYHTHTHKHKTHTRACALNTKTNKIKEVKDVEVKKNNEKLDELWC